MTTCSNVHVAPCLRHCCGYGCCSPQKERLFAQSLHAELLLKAVKLVGMLLCCTADVAIFLRWNRHSWLFSFAFAGQASVGPFACAAQVSARFVVCLFACLFYVVCVTFRCDVRLWFVLSVLVCCVGLCVTVRCEVWSWFVLSALVCCALACGAVCSGTISWACSQEMLANVPSPSGRARNYYYYYCYNYDGEEKE